jgi:hypothetical protein
MAYRMPLLPFTSIVQSVLPPIAPKKTGAVVKAIPTTPHLKPVKPGTKRRFFQPPFDASSRHTAKR